MTALGVVSEGVEGGCFTFTGVFCDVFSEGGAVQGSAGVLRGGVVGRGGGFITIFVRFSASSGLFLVTIGGFFTPIAGRLQVFGGGGGSGSSLTAFWTTRTGETPSRIFSGTLSFLLRVVCLSFL